MDEVYRDIYLQLYSSSQLDVGQKREFDPNLYLQTRRTELDAETLRQMIDSAERETFAEPTIGVIFTPYAGRRLRPDAKLFLLINFLQMIVLPVSLSERGSNVDLRRILFADTVTLLKQSADETNERDVSSHAVLKALTKNWKKLNFSALKLWED
jgi:hypothetical protein